MFERQVLLLALCGGILTACTGTATDDSATASVSRGAETINGAGATFPYPLYSKWFAEYERLHPSVRINYQSVGSGGGIRQLTNRTVFFGATDGPMTDEQLTSAAQPILHVPTVLGAVVPIYNVPGVTTALRFSGPVLADIVLGTIQRWNDPRLRALNPGVALPGTEITFVHRSDGSGTTFILVDYLSKISSAFRERVGISTSVMWPVGVGGKGNEGVAGLVQQTPGSLGYVELVYALQTKLPTGAVQNASGEFVTATMETVTNAAAASTTTIPADFRVSITNPPGKGVYPISSFTWMLFHEQPTDAVRARAMKDFMRWALTDGQQFATDLGYARLPPTVATLSLSALDRIAVP